MDWIFIIVEKFHFAVVLCIITGLSQLKKKIIIYVIPKSA